MKLRNKDVPLEKFMIGFPDEALQSLEIREKLVTLVRLMDDLAVDIQTFEEDLPDRQSILNRNLRTRADVEFMVELEDRILEFIRTAEHSFFPHFETYIRFIAMSPELKKTIETRFNRRFRRLMRNVNRTKRSVQLRLDQALDCTSEEEDLVGINTRQFNDRFRELPF